MAAKSVGGGIGSFCHNGGGGNKRVLSIQSHVVSGCEYLSLHDGNQKVSTLFLKNYDSSALAQMSGTRLLFSRCNYWASTLMSSTPFNFLITPVTPSVGKEKC